MADVEFIDNSEEVLRLLAGATVKAAEAVGMNLENAAKRMCSPKGPNGNPFRDADTLRNSITHSVENDPEGPVLMVGSNMQVAPYIELGTGKFYDPSPEWIQYNGDDKHSVAGLDYWFYYDELEGVLKVGKPIPAQPYLRPAFLDHVDDIRITIQDNLENAGG